MADPSVQQNNKDVQNIEGPFKTLGRALGIERPDANAPQQEAEVQENDRRRADFAQQLANYQTRTAPQQQRVQLAPAAQAQGPTGVPTQQAAGPTVGPAFTATAATVNHTNLGPAQTYDAAQIGPTGAAGT